MAGLRVVMTISSFRPTVGGGEKQAERLARSLVARGHEVTVLTRLVDPSLEPSELLDPGVKVVRVPGRGRSGYSASMMRWIAAHRRSIDLVHAHQSGSPLVVAAGSSRLLGIPALCTPMTAHPELAWARPGSLDGHSLLRRWWFRPTRRWIAKSEEIARALEPYAPGRVDRIPNGVDTDAYLPAAPARAAEPTVLYVGRLREPKRLDLLLGAWARLRPRARLRIVGDGPQLGMLRDRARAPGVTGVEVLGERGDVLDLLRDADVFVLPSDFEGMPNALLEAMSCGLACIGSAVGAIPELLDGGAGLCVPPGDEAALAAALGRLLAGPEERARLGREARRRAVSRYGLAEIAARVEATYLRALLTPGRERPPPGP